MIVSADEASLITAEPFLKLNKSAPSPPVIVFVPVPLVKINSSSPVPPEIVLPPPVAVILSLSAPPSTKLLATMLIVSFPAPPSIAFAVLEPMITSSPAPA